MAKLACDFRCLLIPAAVAFFYIQMRLFATQSEYADRLASAIESENHCASQMRLLIDQISTQQGRIVAFEEERKRRDEECSQLKALVEDLERKGLKRVVDKIPVAAVVIMACNRADYLERTVKSILKYQTSVASKYPLFISQQNADHDCNVENCPSGTYRRKNGRWKLRCFCHVTLGPVNAVAGEVDHIMVDGV